MDLSLNLENTHVLITGGSGFIGAFTVTALLSAGASVTSLDLRWPETNTNNRNFQHYQCDISAEDELESVFALSAEKFGPVACCIALASLDLSALPHHDSLVDMDVEQWRRTQKINVEGTFLTARTWMRQLKKYKDSQGEGKAMLHNVSLIVVGSESGHFGERGNADYAAGKSAVQVGLVKSLMGDVARLWPGARVNAVAPGPVNTPQFRRECVENPDQLYADAQATCALKRPVPLEDVAKSILFLASENWSGSITGQILNVDSGKQGKLMWSKDT